MRRTSAARNSPVVGSAQCRSSKMIEQRSIDRLHAQEAQEQLERVLLRALRAHRRQRRRHAGRDREERREHRQGPALGAGVHPCREPRQLRFRRILGADAGGELDVLDDRMQRAIDVVRRALEAQGHAAVAEPIAQRFGDTRLADSGLAHEHGGASALARRRLPAVVQPREVGLPADDGCQLGCVRGLEMAGDRPRRDHLPDPDRRAEALDRLRPEVLAEEAPAEERMRAGSDDHAARRRRGVQPACEVRRLAEDGFLLGGAVADEVARDDESGRYPHAGRQRPGRRRRRPQPGDRLDHAQAGTDGALGIILVGVRVAEENEDPVAHVPRDRAAELPHHRGARRLEPADHVAQLLELQVVRKRRGSDEVAEEHRDLPALGGDLPGWPRPARGQVGAARTAELEAGGVREATGGAGRGPVNLSGVAHQASAVLPRVLVGQRTVASATATGLQRVAHRRPSTHVYPESPGSRHTRAIIVRLIVTGSEKIVDRRSNRPDRARAGSCSRAQHATRCARVGLIIVIESGGSTDASVLCRSGPDRARGGVMRRFIKFGQRSG